MDFHKLISERKSVRSYNPDRKISEDILKRILNAGRLAPSATNRQPWQFLLVSSEEMLKKVKLCYKSEWFQSVPYVLIVKGNRKEAWIRSTDGYNSLETDLTIAMDHMILAAEYEGISTCWVAAFSPDKLRKTLNLKEEEEVFAITPLGYSMDGFVKKGQKKRKTFEEVVKYI